ncbi:MAG TPA: hypothetical protein VFK69_04860, partial [Candidatus Eisenbacteria bacterium]|nr:hypothetical protein [Candidatus Eisenbacteria bacterium]
MSEANHPMSEANHPVSEANDPMSDPMSAPVSVTPFVLAALDALDPATRARLQDRSDAVSPGVVARVRDILARVRAEGDAALRALTLELDGVALESLEVPRAGIAAAADRVG